MKRHVQCIELVLIGDSPFFLVCVSFFCDVDEDEALDASSPIPLDDGTPVDFSAIEVIQCLIEHHNAIFTDANETVWR